jgi:hypothetical protein
VSVPQGYAPHPAEL